MVRPGQAQNRLSELLALQGSTFSNAGWFEFRSMAQETQREGEGGLGKELEGVKNG